MINKKGVSGWIWILIILILIIVGVVIYLLASGNDISSIVSGASSVPRPPALPSG